MYLTKPNTHKYNVLIENNTGVVGWAFFNTIWNTLNTINEWNSYNKKIMTLSFMEKDQIGYDNNNRFYIHTNTVITWKTNVTEYYTSISKHINNYYDNSYFVKDNYKYVLIEFIAFLPRTSTAIVPYKPVKSPFTISKRTLSSIFLCFDSN